MRISKVLSLSFAVLGACASGYGQIYVNLSSWGGFPYDIDGQGGGGPFNSNILSGPSQHVIASNVTLYCDSVSQHTGIPSTFEVTVDLLNVGGAHDSLDPWVIKNGFSEAASWGGGALSSTQITTAIQGVIWNLDGQIASGTMTSSDLLTAQFANYLLGDTVAHGTYITGYARYDAGINYGPGGSNEGQTQIGAAPTPEPTTLLALGLPLVALARRRKLNRS